MTDLRIERYFRKQRPETLCEKIGFGIIQGISGLLFFGTAAFALLPYYGPFIPAIREGAMKSVELERRGYLERSIKDVVESDGRLKRIIYSEEGYRYMFNKCLINNPDPSRAICSYKLDGVHASSVYDALKKRKSSQK